MGQSLPTTLAQVTAGNRSESLLNEIHIIIIYYNNNNNIFFVLSKRNY